MALDPCGCHETPGRVFVWCPLHKAAPELLEALRSLCNETDGAMHIAEYAIRKAVGNTNATCILNRVEQARAAIAKAEGK